LFRLLLVSLGHQVILVENGREACEVALESRPHLVFMDLQMPVMNGYEATAELRKQGLQCPIVAVTASALKGELERCQAAGMNGILTKPFNLETLDTVVRSYAPRVAEIPVRAPLAPASSSSEQVFSLDDALQVFLGNRDLLVKLVTKFRQQTRPALDKLDQALAAGDAVAMRSGAHALKGSSANLTAQVLAKAAETLEQAAADGNLGEAPAQIAAIRAAFESFESAVADLSSLNS
jgi:CheY-like chemotaxis protein